MIYEKGRNVCVYTEEHKSFTEPVFGPAGAGETRSTSNAGHQAV